MSYIQSFKGQTWLMPPNIEELIPEDHICFLVESFVESLDLSSFDQQYAGAGHPAYHPRVLLKLMVIGILDKVRSSRMLARSARENIVYMYLAEKLTPDFRTISDFRKNNPNLVKTAFKHTVTIAKNEGLLDLSILSTDGTKIKANAANKRIISKEELLFLLSFVENELEEWAKQDTLEDDFFGNLRGSDQLPEKSKKKMQKAVRYYIDKTKKKGKNVKEQIKYKLKRAQDQIVKNPKLNKVSITDPESRFMMNKKGKLELSYNPQLTVDKHGFILANDVCQDTVDNFQLEPQVIETKKNVGRIPKGTHWNFDNGYYGWNNIALLERENIDAYIPDQELAQKINKKQVYQDTLSYNPEKDIFLTPEGKEFTFQYKYFDKTKKGRLMKVYVMRENNKIVKTIKVSPYYPERKRMKIKMRSGKAKEVYNIRAQTVEPVIGDFKENKGMRAFLTRSIETVRTEFNLVSIAHNLRKITIKKQLNRDGFLEKIKVL